MRLPTSNAGGSKPGQLRSKSTASSAELPQHQQDPASVSANGQLIDGKASAKPISLKGTEGKQTKEQPIDMERLLSVSSAVQKMAAEATDADTVLLKVLLLSSLPYMLVSAMLLLFAHEGHPQPQRLKPSFTSYMLICWETPLLNICDKAILSK